MILDARTAPALSGRVITLGKMYPYYVLNKFQKGVKPRYFKFVDASKKRTLNSGQEVIIENGNIVEVNYPAEYIDEKEVIENFAEIRKSALYEDENGKQRSWIKTWHSGRIEIDEEITIPEWSKEEEGLVNKQFQEGYINLREGVYRKIQEEIHKENLRSDVDFSMDQLKFLFEYNSETNDPGERYKVTCLGLCSEEAVKELKEEMGVKNDDKKGKTETEEDKKNRDYYSEEDKKEWAKNADGDSAISDS